MNTIKTLELKNVSFVLPATFDEFCKQDDQAATNLADAILDSLGGSRFIPECFICMKGKISNYEPTANAMVNGKWADITEEQRDQLVSDLEDSCTDENAEDTDQAIESLNDLEFDQYPEIYQWFSLDGRLLRHLEKLGECVLNDRYWGYTVFGQSMTLAYNFQLACFNIARNWGTDVSNENLKDIENLLKK